MEQYLNLLRTIKEKGTWKKESRPKLGRTLSLFGHQYRCNLQDGFPLLTTKKVSLKNISTELIWMLRGGSPLNIKYLVDQNCNIWNQDAYRWYLKECKESELYEISFDSFVDAIKTGKTNKDLEKVHDGSFGFPDESYQLGDCPLGYELWRNFNGVDQIAELISNLKENPTDRGHQLTALNPAYRDVALRPCHVYAQFNCREIDEDVRIEMALKQNQISYRELMFDVVDNPERSITEQLDQETNIPKYYLDCQLYQRSCDVFLGVPYNTASYALLTHIIAEICGFAVGDFVHTFGDVHIYENHMEAVDEQLSRTPSELPKLKKLGQNFDFMKERYEIDGKLRFDYLFTSDFTLENYNPQPSIKAELKTGL